MSALGYFKDPAERLPEGWRRALAPEFGKGYFGELAEFLSGRSAQGREIYPERSRVFSALESVDLDAVRVVILGQDPYHGPGQAIGMSFAVPNALQPKPPSLKNIFKELESDLATRIDPARSDLSGWAAQGVLLLNSVLTVEAGEPLSHRDQGWEKFTDHVMEILNRRERGIVFVLWGAAAQKKKTMIDLSRHVVIESVHPSPLSAHRGFFGSKPFSKANEALTSRLGTPAIDWSRTSDAS